MRLAKPWRRHLAARRTRRRTSQYREFIRREAAIGGELFGPVAQNARREFVCVNRHTWLWHEEWADPQNIWHMATTRYDVRPDGIFKMQDGQSYRPVSQQEARHLRTAAILYDKHVGASLYKK